MIPLFDFSCVHWPLRYLAATDTSRHTFFARPVLAWALVVLGSLWHWAVAPSASMLHCTVAVCSVASLTGSQSAEDTR